MESGCVPESYSTVRLDTVVETIYGYGSWREVGSVEFTYTSLVFVVLARDT